MAQDLLQESKERYQDITDHFSDFRERRLEDLKFSNPDDPQQWDDQVRQARENAPGGARPCLTFDHTNQYINQVVNDARQNKPGIKVLPVDNGADIKTASALEGMIRQIEDQSRASIAYDTAIDHAARCGVGWMRVITEMCNPALNEQEIRIKAVVDPLSCMISPESVEPDGSDATDGYITSVLSKAAFEKQYGTKAAQTSWDAAAPLWFKDDAVRICERYYQVKTKKNRLYVQLPDSSTRVVDEEQYWNIAREIGTNPIVLMQFMDEQTTVKWLTMTGAEILDETEVPSPWIPIVPVYGNVLWIDGKRSVCGLTRQLMDGQRAKNYERSAGIEMIALQPKSPFILPFESVQGFEQEWKTANTANMAYLPYNALDPEGNQLPAPQRLAPPPIPGAFIQGAQMASDDMQAAIGMYKSNLGAPSNATSGRAKMQDQREGDTATYHYVDNQRRSIEHVGRIVVNMIPSIYDTEREARILGMNGDISVVKISPDATGYQEGKVPTINPATGKYDVRVKAGPSYATQRQEASDALTQVLTQNPGLMSILGPTWARAQDWPEADKVAKILLAMAPPQVQALEKEGSDDMPPAAQAQISSMQQQIQQLQEQLKQASQAADENQRKAAFDMKKLEIEEFDAVTKRQDSDTKRIVALNPPDPGMTPEQVQLLVMQMMQQQAQPPAQPLQDDDQPPMQQMQPQPQQQPMQPPEGMQMQQAPVSQPPTSPGMGDAIPQGNVNV
jgi:hypothetical protein